MKNKKTIYFKIKIHKLKYFKEIWNILDVVILIISYVCIGFNIYRTISVNNLLDELLVNNNQYRDFEVLTYGQLSFNNAVAILTFLCWIKVKKKKKKKNNETQTSFLVLMSLILLTIKNIQS